MNTTCGKWDLRRRKMGKKKRGRGRHRGRRKRVPGKEELANNGPSHRGRQDPVKPTLIFHRPCFDRADFGQILITPSILASNMEARERQRVAALTLQLQFRIKKHKLY